MSRLYDLVVGLNKDQRLKESGSILVIKYSVLFIQPVLARLWTVLKEVKDNIFTRLYPLSISGTSERLKFYSLLLIIFNLDWGPFKAIEVNKKLVGHPDAEDTHCWWRCFVSRFAPPSTDRPSSPSQPVSVWVSALGKRENYCYLDKFLH